MLPANIGGDIDPKWSTCAQWNYGIPDPPKALVPAGTVDPAVTKGPSLSIYTAPSPGSTPERAEAPNTAIVTSPSSTSTPALNPVAHTAKQSAGPASDGKQSPSGDGHSLEPESKLSAQEAGVTYPTRTQPVDPLPANPLAASAQLSPSQDPAEPISLLLLGGETLTPVLGSSTLVIMNGQTLIPGAAASVVAGVTISYDRGSIFVNGEGGPVPTMTAAPAALPHWDGSYSVATANTKDFSNALFAPNPAMNSLFVATYGNGQELIGKVLGTSVVDVAGSFVTPGAPAIVVNNARVSVDRSMSQIVVDGEPQALPQPSRSSAPTDPIAAAFSSIFGRPAPQGTDPRLKGGFGNFDTRPVGDPNQILPLGMGNVAGHAITAAPSGAVAFHGTTVRPGDPAVTVKGAVFSLDSTGSVVIDGKTYSLPPVVGAGSNAQPIATVAGNFISMDAFGAVTINGQSLKPGDSAVTISGTRVSLGDAGLVVGPSTIPLPQPQKQIAGFEVTTDGAGNVLISGNTLHPGDPAIWVSGTRVSLGNAGLVVGPSTVPLPQSQNQIAGFEFNTDGAGNVMISGKTLHPGDPAIWVSGTRVSLGSAGLIVGSSTVPLPQSQNQIAGFEFNTDGAGNVLISGNTLHPGDPAIWISGTRISLGTDGLAFGTSTIPLSAIPTRAGQVDFATDAAGDLLISGKTLHPGDPAIWVSGTRISLGSDGLAVGTSTIPLLGIATRVGQVDFATDAAGNLLISGKTLHPGDPPIWVSGTRISLGTDGLAVGTSTIPLLAIPTRAGQVGVTTDAGGNAIIGGTTLHRGDPAITVSGTRISLGDSGLVIGTQTIPISSPSTQIAGLHITTDGAGNVIVNDIILHPGDAAIIISGTKVSLGNNGVLSAGTQTLQVSSLPTAIAGMQVSTDRNGNIILNNGLVIHPGDVITVSGTRVSLGADGMLTAGTITVPTSLFPTEIAGLSITPDGNGNMILNSALVIHPGDAITVSGTRISLGADGILTAGTITVPTSSVPTEIAGISITTDGNGNIILNNTRIIHPGDAVTVSGTRVFLGADGILTAGTFTIPASSFPTGVPPITTDGNGNIIFNNTLIHPGDAVTVSGMRISLGTDGILTAGTFTIPVSSLPASFPAEIAGLSITTDGNGDIILNNTLLIHPGDAITVSGTRISLGSDGTLTAGTFTVPASSLPTAIAGFPITTDSVGDVLIAGTTLHPGDPAITISGTRISLGTNGILTAGSKTIPINIPKVFTVGGLVFTSIAGGVVVGGTTLMNGAPARTINEKLVSVDVNGVVSVGGIWSSELSTTSQVSPAFKETASASLRQVPADGGVAPTATHKKKGGAAGVDMPEWGSQIVLVVVLAWLLHVLVLG
ncbi:MAG: hypothetical protein M1836_006382 [Candelina mexicana]|nr:MAG: hypothetical protein M1836_006382 [Candelina mexicana]